MAAGGAEPCGPAIDYAYPFAGVGRFGAVHVGDGGAGKDLSGLFWRIKRGWDSTPVVGPIESRC
jgi:hypothetical protein